MLTRSYNKNMRKQPYNDRGKFDSPYPEPLAKKIIGVRLAENMDATVRRVAGNDLSAWVRSAIAEKLEREGIYHELQHTLLENEAHSV